MLVGICDRAEILMPMHIARRKELKIYLSRRDNKTIIRYLDIANNQTTAGQTIYGAQLTVDYALSKNLTALFYYDHSFSEYAISTAFPQTTIRGGFTLRYNFGN